MDDSEILGMAAAIRNHLAMKPVKAYTAQEIAEFGREWPAIPWPMDLVLSALAILEATGVVDAIQDSAGKRWKKLESK